MAEKTPETNDETTEAAPEAPEQPVAGEATEPADTGATAEQGAGEDQAEQSAEPQQPVPARERRAAERQQQASRRPPRSPEERQAEREKDRAAKAALRRTRRQRERKKAREVGATRPAPAVQKSERAGGRQKVRQGVVVSAKPDKTITVRIDAARRHRRYQKIVRSSTTLHVHDERNEANEGDTVRVVESRPLSRTKRWRLVEITERAR